ILKSDNGGVSWTQQTINSNGGVSNICFPSDSIGYCYHHFGGNSIDTLYLFKTIDAGTTWFLKSSVYAMNFITDMTFTNDTTGYFAGFFQVQNTIDGGTTWQYQNSTGICNDFFDNSYDLFFLDNNHGFMAGGFGAGEFYRIDKGGEVISTIDIVEKHQLNLKIYPNPTSGFVSIEYNQRKKATINIFNISGQLIHSEILSGNTTKQLDLSNFSKGVYLIKISNDEMIETQKLVVE
ncbi:MAG: T9SS type A sorting domain-containing protein, partial [Saprospiraceae bacterium]|nr:T9SS type A sorting domain-containing protein [Saprospiraceae bacterium]